MTDEYGDTSVGSTEDSQTSGYEADDYSQETGDTGSESEAEKSPVPYERFKESREQVSDLKNEISSLKSQYQETAQWNQWAWQQLQEGQQQAVSPVEEESYYSDPLEKRVNELESKLTQQSQFYDHRHQQMQVAQAEREILAEMNAAKSKYPDMRESEVVQALTKSPHASIMKLAKRSHEAENNAFNNKLLKSGYKPKPKPLQRSSGGAPVKQDFGDSLDAAEAAYLGTVE